MLARYFHTLRHLRLAQIVGRLWHRVNPAMPDQSKAPSRRPPGGQWSPPATPRASMHSGGGFRFLSVDGQVHSAADWNNPAQEKLWLYNLHYFDDLNASGASDRVEWHHALVERWVLENPPPLGNGWEPYPTSRRIVNWIKWALARHDLEATWIHSLAVQTRWLRRHVEWHLLGNHLFVNAKALVFAGLFFDGDEAQAWLAHGLDILAREVPEQILADGAHFELSPMYHALILEDVLDLVNIANASPGIISEAVVEQWRKVALQMLDWLKALIHPDGDIAFFNDAALGISPDFATLLAYARRIGLKSISTAPFAKCTHLTASGYVRLEQGDAVALLDVARIGPDYLPGHGHADTLSFELSLFGQRVVVNSGTSRYGLGPERLRQRATAAHSTVEVDSKNSSEVWGGFRVARRARPFALSIADTATTLTVSCSHNGYQRLVGKPIHHRHWRLDEHRLQVRDSIEGDFRTAVARYHLHPSIKVTGGGKAGQLLMADGRSVAWSVSGGNAHVVSASWHPEFGLSVPCVRIDVLFDGQEAQIEFAWN